MLTTLLFLATQAFAGENADINVTVKGMVCSFCVQGIEKKFKGESSVDNVKVNLDESLVSIWLKESHALSDDRIEVLIKDSGYNVAEIKRQQTKEEK